MMKDMIKLPCLFPKQLVHHKSCCLENMSWLVFCSINENFGHRKLTMLAHNQI